MIDCTMVKLTSRCTKSNYSLKISMHVFSKHVEASHTSRLTCERQQMCFHATLFTLAMTWLGPGFHDGVGTLHGHEATLGTN